MSTARYEKCTCPKKGKMNVARSGREPDCKAGLSSFSRYYLLERDFSTSRCRSASWRSSSLRTLGSQRPAACSPRRGTPCPIFCLTSFDKGNFRFAEPDERPSTAFHSTPLSYSLGPRPTFVGLRPNLRQRMPRTIMRTRWTHVATVQHQSIINILPVFFGYERL